jgi:hypothetical protein
MNVSHESHAVLAIGFAASSAAVTHECWTRAWVRACALRERERARARVREHVEEREYREI